MRKVNKKMKIWSIVIISICWIVNVALAYKLGFGSHYAKFSLSIISFILIFDIYNLIKG